jgi:uncharacterized protein (TIGR02996 family)
VSSQSSEIAELYARVAAAPAEVGPRLVLADALQLAGDPRGELIALQLAIADGTADGRAPARAAALEKRHLAEWTAALPGVVHAELDRGFLSAVHLRAPGDALEHALARPEWATVERLELTAFGGDPTALVRRMPLLRALSAGDAALQLLARSGPHPAIRALGVERWVPPDRAAFPSLAVLGGSWISAHFDAGRFRAGQQRAAELGLAAIAYLSCAPGHLRAALGERARGPREMRFGCAHRRRVGLDAPGWRVRVPRDGHAAAMAWAGGQSSPDTDASVIAGAIADAGFTEIAVHVADQRTRRAVERALSPWSSYRTGPALRWDDSPIDLSLPP